MNSAIPFALTSSCFTARLPRDESSSLLEVLRNPSAAWANFSETLHVPGFLPVRSVRQVLSCGADVCEPPAASWAVSAGGSPRLGGQQQSRVSHLRFSLCQVYRVLSLRFS